MTSPEATNSSTPDPTRRHVQRRHDEAVPVPRQLPVHDAARVPQRRATGRRRRDGVHDGDAAPVHGPPREGAALVWANCELENVPTIDTRRPGDVWDEGRCMGGAGPHDMAAYSPGPMPGEHAQRPCCVGREFRSLHQSRPVTRGAEKWTMTMWMHQRFTDESRQFADVFGYDGFPGQSASDT